MLFKPYDLKTDMLWLKKTLFTFLLVGALLSGFALDVQCHADTQHYDQNECVQCVSFHHSVVDVPVTFAPAHLFAWTYIEPPFVLLTNVIEEIDRPPIH